MFVFVLGVWFVLPGASKERFRSAWDWQHDANASSRVMFWKAGLVMFEDNPVLGVGPGNFALVNPYHFVSHSLYIRFWPSLVWWARYLLRRFCSCFFASTHKLASVR